MQIYQNGVLKSTGSALAISSTILNAVNFTIGAASDGGIPFDGLITDVRFYKTQLKAKDVEELYRMNHQETLLQPALRGPGTRI